MFVTEISVRSVRVAQKSFRVPSTLLASMCHAMPFSARVLKKNILFDVDIVVKSKSKCGLSWSVLLPTTSTCNSSFPKHFFRIVSAYFNMQVF